MTYKGIRLLLKILLLLLIPGAMRTMATRDFPSLEEIHGVKDILDAMDILDEFNVDYTGLETVEELIGRLELESERQQGADVKGEVEEGMQKASEDDERKRSRLITMFNSLEKIMGTDSESARRRFVEDFLEKDGTSTNVLDDCRKWASDLQEGEKVLLIAGQSTAGKSTFLNLLLNLGDFLPTSVLSCTSVITTIRYGTKRTAKVLFSDPGRDDVLLDLEMPQDRKQFHSYIFQQNRDADHGIKEVQVTTPSEILKGGLVVADTPGIGENEFLEDYLMEYIAQNEILAFVYIIFSDDGGGVKDDRLLNLLKLVMKEQKKGKKVFPFDPKSTLFVANRFDLVPESERDKVKEHIIEKLTATWPEFDKSMVVFFSTMLAQRDINAHPHYINDNYRQLLQSFSDLYFYGMEKRLRIAYKWIENVLQRIRHCLKTAVRRLAMSQRDNDEQTRRQKLRLTKLNDNANTELVSLKADIISKEHQLASDVKEYLLSPTAETRLCSAWGKDEIPAVSDTIRDVNHWRFIKQRVDDAFYDRVCTDIEEWTNEKNLISNVEQELVKSIESKLGVLQGEILESEYEMDHSLRSNESGRRCSRYVRRMSLRPASIEVPTKLPLRLNFRVFAFGARSERKGFSKDPIIWTQKRSRKLLEKLRKNKPIEGSEEGPLDMLITQLMQRPRAILQTLELKIPSIIEANMKLLDRLEELRLDHHHHSFEFERMAADIETLKETLMSYGQGFIFVHDFKSCEIRIIDEQTSSGDSLSRTYRIRIKDLVPNGSGRHTAIARPSLVPQGLWSYISPGMLQRDGREKPISIKLYKPCSGVTNTIPEVAKLRCLVHDGVPLAEFLGIHHTDAQTPSYIYDGNLINLQRYIHNQTETRKTIPSILEEIATGVEYLHSKKMVHMELSTETVTLNRNGTVKLTGACLPRTATLPLDTDKDTVSVDKFVYLSKEVLNSELYVSSSDTYGFGLLMYEVLLDTKAYKNERSKTFQDFADSVDPIRMLGLENRVCAYLPQPVIDVIKKCVTTIHINRPTIGGVQLYLSHVQQWHL